MYTLVDGDTVMQSLYIVYLNRQQLGDSLFLKSLAQRFAEGTSGEPPCLLLHGSGEKVERTFESKGLFPERAHGVLQVETEDQRRLVERAVREVNQELVATLTDEVVSAVGIQGVDRNLLSRSADGTVEAKNVGWLSALLKQRVVPVVSALVDSASGPAEEIRPESAAVALARSLEASFDPTVCFLSDSEVPSADNADGARTEGQIHDLSEDVISDVEAVEYIHDRDVPILITTLEGLLLKDPPTGMRIPSSG